MRSIITLVLLTFSNIFMTIAWYGHLKFKEFTWGQNLSLGAIILISWAFAFFEYCLQVPANRIGFNENGGPYNLVQLKVIQEVISLLIFVIFTLLIFKHETFKWNYIISFFLLVGAVYFAFKK